MPLTDGEACPLSESHIDADIFRGLWRGFGSSVALIATQHEDRRYAMLATAVTSLSMEPPSLLICVNRSASAYPAVAERGTFSLGILPATSRKLGAAIADASGEDRFASGAWRSHDGGEPTLTGLPWLEECQGTLFCRISKSSDFGTHTVFMATVLEHAGEAGSDPLLYCDGRYGRFESFSA